jgi:hypothetical protein
MGQTKVMVEREKHRRNEQLKKEGHSGIDVLTDEMKELAGMNHTYIRDFSGGTSGLRRVDLTKKEKK